jgi:hypothetical protein
MVQVNWAFRLLEMLWLGGRDSNPDSQIQSLESYHWTTSQQEKPNLRSSTLFVNQAHFAAPEHA